MSSEEKATPKKRKAKASSEPSPVLVEESSNVSSHSEEQLTTSTKEQVDAKASELVFDDMQDANMTLEDEVRELVLEARTLPTGQRRLVLLDLAEQYPSSIWPFVDLSSIMSRAKENIEMAERGLHNATRFSEPSFVEKNKGRYWELPETRPYMQLLMNKARGLMEVRRLDAALDLMQKVLEL
ncbi:MAG: hypothetical protein J5I53_05360 [Bradyrhizobiaceae bacterium]|nr:hypothetical protein [Bradyrhizobiaceae bacterium]